MRAETQNNVDAIAKSLKLLAQRMDWDTAPHRLEEFDAMIEAPDLWNDPAKAQKLMRERQQLLDAVWGRDIHVEPRTVDVHIRKLREKIPEYYIKTLKGVGYLFSIEKA